MKTFIMILSLIFTGAHLYAQQNTRTYRSELPGIVMDGRSSLHIISPEPIRYVDISTHGVVGDLPEPNVLRLKWLADSVGENAGPPYDLGVVTVIGESFMAQYGLRANRTVSGGSLTTSFRILPHHTQPLHVPVELTTPELRRHAVSLLASRNASPVSKASDYGIHARLNSVYTVGDLVLLDITYLNTTNLVYDIDEMRFKIEDKKITKATNVQSIEIKPVWQLYPLGTFKRSYRNIYALEKVTFPENKVLNVELSEQQISGRTITLKIRYRDILRADTF